MSSVVDELIAQMARDWARFQESQLRAMLRPKPRWLPSFAYRRVIARLIVLEVVHSAGVLRLPREYMPGLVEDGEQVDVYEFQPKGEA